LAAPALVLAVAGFCYSGGVVASAQELKLRKALPESSLSVAFSPDGKSLAVAMRMAVLDAATGKVRYHLKGNKSWAWAAAFSPDGKTLATALDNGTVQLFDAVTGQDKTVLKGLTSHVFAVAFSPDGKWVAAGGIAGFKLWDAATGKPRAVQGPGQLVHCLAFSPDGKTLAVGTVVPDGDSKQSPPPLKDCVRLWDVATGKVRATLFTGTMHGVRALAFSPNGKVLVSGTGELFDKGKTGRLTFWGPATGKALATRSGIPGGVLSVAFSRDGKLLATGSGALAEQGVLRLWDATSRKELASVVANTNGLCCVAFSPDGRTLASCGREGEEPLRLWDLPAGK
jgi:WD40 repeat protein